MSASFDVPEQSTAAVAAPAKSFWPSVLEALRGTRHDFTDGPIGRAILLLAVPMVLEMVLESVFALVDVFWVSRLGADAVATVGLTESMLALIYALAMGVSMAAAATVARRIGEKNPSGAAQAAVQAIALGLTLSLPIGVAGVMLAPKLLALVGGSPSLIATGWRYTAVVLGANGIVLLLFLMNAIFRGAGDAFLSMRVLWLANLINLVLDPCFIFGLGPFPRLGVTGAAVATATGRGVGVLCQIALLAAGRGRVVIRREDLRLNPAVMWQLLRISASGILQMIIGTASWLGLVRILSAFGSAAIAGYTIAIRMILFALLPSWGMANAAATMVGQNLGAKKPERGERAVWLAGFYNMLFLGVVGLVFALFPHVLVGFFTGDQPIEGFAADCLRFVSLGFVFYAYGMVLSQAFNGAGDTFTPTLLNLFCFWLWEIPAAYFLSHQAGVGPRGVFLAITTAFSMLAVMAAVQFRRGNWKMKRV